MVMRAFVYGLAAAAGVSAWTMIEYLLGFHTVHAEVGRYSGFVGLLFPIAAIVLGIAAARRARGGLIGFGEAFAQGAAISVVSSALGAVSIWLYLTVINPGFLASPAGQGATLSGQIMAVLGGGLLFGGLVSLAAAAAMRRRTVRA